MGGYVPFRPTSTTVSGYPETYSNVPGRGPSTSMSNAPGVPNHGVPGRRKVDVVDLRSAVNSLGGLLHELHTTPDKQIFSNLTPDQWQSQLEIELLNLAPVANLMLDATEVCVHKFLKTYIIF